MRALNFVTLIAMGLAVFVFPAPLAAAIKTSATLTSVKDTSSSLPRTALPIPVGKGNGGARHIKNIERIKEGPVDLLFLGDSITYRWTTVPELWKASFGQWKPANFGVNGNRTENVIWRITNGELDGISPKVVVLMIGTNNTHTDSPEDIVTGIRRIIEIVHEKQPQAKVLLFAIFPREPRLENGVEVTLPMDKIRVINKQLPKLAADTNVRYMDITDDFLVDGKVPADVMPDQVHPSEKGYRIWAKAIVPVIEDMMSTATPGKSEKK